MVRKVFLALVGLGMLGALGWWLYASVFVGRVAAVLVSPTGTLFLGRITWFPHPVLHDPWMLIIDPPSQTENAEGTAQAQGGPRILPWASAVPFTPKGKRLSIPRESIVQWSYLDKTDNFRQFLARDGQATQQNTFNGIGALSPQAQQQGGLQQQPAPGNAPQLQNQPRF